MKTKICSHCGKEKNVSEFTKNKRKKDGLCYWCKQCRKEYDRRNNKEIKEWIDTIKLGIGCQVCGYNKCAEALEFHHRNPKEKNFTISSLPTTRKEILLQEMEKCILLCATHHREVEAGIIQINT